MSGDFFFILSNLLLNVWSYALQTVKMPDFSWIMETDQKGWTVLRRNQKLCVAIELKQLILLSVPF